MENGLIINGKSIELSEENIQKIAEALNCMSKESENISKPKPYTSDLITEEQREKIISEFTLKNKESFYYINGDKVSQRIPLNNPDLGESLALECLGNYCHNSSIMIYRWHRENLARLIWRFALENNRVCLLRKYNPAVLAGFPDTQIMDYKNMKNLGIEEKCKICYFTDEADFGLSFACVTDRSFDITDTYFDSEEIAWKCVNEVVVPYIQGHLAWFPEYQDCYRFDKSALFPF